MKRVFLALSVLMIAAMACNLPRFGKPEVPSAPAQFLVHPSPTPKPARDFHSLSMHYEDLDPKAEGQQPGTLVTFYNDSGLLTTSANVFNQGGQLVKVLTPQEMEAQIFDPKPGELYVYSIEDLYIELPDGRKCVRFGPVGVELSYSCEDLQ